jgi:hypothetical protein
MGVGVRDKRQVHVGYLLSLVLQTWGQADSHAVGIFHLVGYIIVTAETHTQGAYSASSRILRLIHALAMGAQDAFL